MADKVITYMIYFNFATVSIATLFLMNYTHFLTGLMNKSEECGEARSHPYLLGSHNWEWAQYFKCSVLVNQILDNGLLSKV